MLRNTMMACAALASVVTPVAHQYDKDAQSTNWAGYVAAPQVAVTGAWIVEPTYSHTEVDEWVGMGGYNTPTILQAGVQYDNDGTAWLWTEDYPAPPKHYVQVTLGDEVLVQVTAHKIVVRDVTAHYRHAYHFPRFNATGADAEAIVETHDKVSHPVTPNMFTNLPTTLRMDNTQNAMYPAVVSSNQVNQISF